MPTRCSRRQTSKSRYYVGNANGTLLRLTQSGLTRALAHPTLELLNGTGTSIVINDSWKETQQSGIQTTALAPTNDAESASGPLCNRAITAAFYPARITRSRMAPVGFVGGGSSNIVEFSLCNRLLISSPTFLNDKSRPKSLQLSSCLCSRVALRSKSIINMAYVTLS